MEFKPVIQIIEVDCIREHGAVIQQSVGSEDVLANLVLVDIPRDAQVELVNIGLGQIYAGLGLNPCLELRVGRLLLGDELLEGFRIQSESGNHHAVVSGADAGIARGEFAFGFEGSLEPEPGQVKNAQRAGDAGANKGDVSFAHG